MTLRTFFGASILLAICGCGSSSGSNASGPAGQAGGSGGSSATGGSGGAAALGGGGAAGTAAGGAAAGGAAAGGAAAGGAAGMAAAPKCPTATFKTVVVVGDSISDVGGTGPNQTPFYRTLLVHNDDTLYPAWKGVDFATCWSGFTDMNVVKVSVGGAIATEKMGMQSVLLTQAKSIPKNLPGPVLVVGTIGGNDILAGLTDALIGTPAQQQADVDNYIKGFGDAMAELSQPDRFGAGVKATILMTNIYDPSGGSGDFTYTPEMKKCPGAFTLWPKNMPTDPSLKTWNDAMAVEAAKHPGVQLLDLHTQYKGHEVSQPDPACWFHNDCIHPNTAGHEAIRELFWAAIGTLP